MKNSREMRMTNPPSNENARDEELPQLAAFLDRYVQEREEGMKRHSEALRSQYERPSPMRWLLTVLSLLMAGCAVVVTVGMGTALAGFVGGVLFTLSLWAIVFAHKVPRL